MNDEHIGLLAIDTIVARAKLLTRKT